MHFLNTLNGFPSLIAEALRQKIDQTEKEELEKILEEGYRATAKESLAIAKEFETVDLEGWDEY